MISDYGLGCNWMKYAVFPNESLILKDRTNKESENAFLKHPSFIGKYHTANPHLLLFVKLGLNPALH